MSRATDQGGSPDTQENQEGKQTDDEVLTTSRVEDDVDAVELRCGISIGEKNST